MLLLKKAKFSESNLILKIYHSTSIIVYCIVLKYESM